MIDRPSSKFDSPKHIVAIDQAALDRAVRKFSGLLWDARFYTVDHYQVRHDLEALRPEIAAAYHIERAA